MAEPLQFPPTLLRGRHMQCILIPSVKSECRVVLTGFLGIDEAGGLVRIETDAVLYALPETAADGLIEVNCICCGKHLRVFATDLAERTGTATERRRSSSPSDSCSQRCSREHTARR